MPTWLTQENLNTIALIAVVGWNVARWILVRIAPMTSTTLDDRALSGMKSAEASLEADWIKRSAPAFWAQVETMGKAGAVGTGLAKLAYYLLIARRAYQDAHGKVLTIAGEKALEVEAAGLSAQEKLLRDAVALPAPVPPASLPTDGAPKA